MADTTPAARHIGQRFAWFPARSPAGHWHWLVETVEWRTKTGTVWSLPLGARFSWRAFFRLCLAVLGTALAIAAVLALVAGLMTVAMLLDGAVAHAGLRA